MKFSLIGVFYLLSVSVAAILGIDYGHQFTKAVMLAPGVQFEILLTEEARRKDLSGISIRPGKSEDIDRVYGSAAQSLCTRFPQYCITGIKPLLGKAVNDPIVRDFLATHHGLKIIEDKERPNAIKFDLGLSNESFVFSPEEILAMNLKELKSRALKHLQDNPSAQSIVDDVAISVPPFITQEQRHAYIDALELAGYSNILDIVDEGTAVAVNLLSNKKFQQSDYNDKKAYHMIYDMGAGSTKATLFSITPFKNMTTVLEFENIGYDEFFGGAALTQSIYTILVEKLAIQLGLDENADLAPRVTARLLEAAEKAKTILSANSEYHVSLESILDEKDFKAVITREEFEDINMDNMARVTKPIMDALAETGVYINDLESVVLTGGSTRVPFVQKHLSVLLGEGRIAKTVNADESCAIGTTVKAFKLKTKFGNDKDFKIIEKAYHNYEASVNNNEILVFKKGSKTGSTERVNLGELTDELDIQMYEDGRLFKSFNIDKILDKSKTLTCNDDKSYTKELFATFTLDANKIFNLKKLEAVCTKTEKEGFFKKLLNGDEETVEVEEQVAAEEEDDVDAKVETQDDSVNSTATTRPSKKVLRPVPISIPRAKYPYLKPMSRPLKQRISEKLSFLDSRDNAKAQLEQTKNLLEAACYELRNFVDDQETALLEEVDLDEIRTLITDTIEWLEFESDESPSSDFENKLADIQNKKEEFKLILKMKDTDLSFEKMKSLYEDGSSMIMKIQSKMLEFGSEISEIRQKYDDEGFDFDKENDRIKLQLINKGDDRIMRLDQTLAKYKEMLTDLGEITQLNEKYFNKIAKSELFQKYEAISNSIVEMLADVLLVDESHKERVNLFTTKLEKMKERKLQKELKDKLKQEKKAKEESAKDEQDSEPIEESESILEDSTETDDLEHDEL